MVNVLPFIPQADRVMRMASDVNGEFFCSSLVISNTCKKIIVILHVCNYCFSRPGLENVLKTQQSIGHIIFCSGREIIFCAIRETILCGIILTNSSIK